MRKKVKSYSLIEILIASMIFMVVAIFGASSFAMITKSNNTTEDHQVSSQCSNQLESFIKNAFETADKGERIFGLYPGSAEDKYKLSKLSFDSPPANPNKNFVGFLAVNATRKRAVFADIGFDASGAKEKFGRYFQKDFNNSELSDADLKNGFEISLNNASVIHNNQCVASMGTTDAGDINKFRIERSRNYLTNSMVYRLSLRDRIFPNLLGERSRAISTGSFAGINLWALNAIKKI